MPTWNFTLTPDWWAGYPLASDASFTVAELTDEFTCAATMQEIETFISGPVEGNKDVPVIQTMKARLKVPIDKLGPDDSGPAYKGIARYRIQKWKRRR